MRRAKAMGMVFLILLFLLAGRLYYVQILCAEELTGAAHGQQMIPVLQENGKGAIYDRNKRPITGTDSAYYYLLHKDNLSTGATQLLDQIGASYAGQKGEDYLVYRTSHYVPRASFVLQKQWKAHGFCVNVRYGENQTAASFIADLDEMYCDMLKKEEPVFYFLGNGAGNLMNGTGMVEETAVSSRSEPAALITTIDLSLQQEIERFLLEEDCRGCVAVTDVRNGQILAMADNYGVGLKEAPNLTVEQAYPLGKIYNLIRKAAEVSGENPAETATMLGLGETVFANYPGEAVGSVASESTPTATVVQVSRILTILANGGKAVPLHFVMSTAREESVPCMEIRGDAAAAWLKLKSVFMEKPLTGDGWSAGYGGAGGQYAVVVHTEKGHEEKILQHITARLHTDG